MKGRNFNRTSEGATRRSPDGLPCIGETVAGRFDVEAEAGAGASGVVFRARDLTDGRRVALKVTYRARASRGGRTFHEAHALAAIEHAAVVRYIAHGDTESGLPFLAMAWLEGETLSQRLARSGLTPVESLRLAQRLSAGLAALHAHGLVHRDLKPSNIILVGGKVEEACIIDLGVARDLNAPSGHTGHGEYIGTPRYMAPEQIRDPQQVVGASDVFALGCILFECLCGAPAFDATEVFAVLAQILFARAPRPTQLRPELPAAFDALLGALLARRPERRPNAGSDLDVQLAAVWVEPSLPQLRAPRFSLDSYPARDMTASLGWATQDARAAG